MYIKLSNQITVNIAVPTRTLFYDTAEYYLFIYAHIKEFIISKEIYFFHCVQLLFFFCFSVSANEILIKKSGLYSYEDCVPRKH